MSLFSRSSATLGRLPREVVFSMAKGLYGRSNRVFGFALRRVMHNLFNGYRERRKRMREFRRFWTVRTNAASREYEVPYGQFTTGLKRANIQLNRRMIATLSETEPISFKVVLDEATAHWKVPSSHPRKIGDL
jgi:large subunit ribosomal protein L20